MENGRVVEVTVKMRGGMGKKRNKKNSNPLEHAIIRE